MSSQIKSKLDKQKSKKDEVKIEPFVSELEIQKYVNKKIEISKEYNTLSSNSNNGEDRYEGKSLRAEDFTQMLPKFNFHFDPVINFKLKQKITKFGASITLGMLLVSTAHTDWLIL